MAKIDVRHLALNEDELDLVSNEVVDESFLAETSVKNAAKLKHQTGFSSTHHKKQSKRVVKDRWVQE